MDDCWVYLLCYDDEDSGLSETMAVFSTLEKAIDICEKHDMLCSGITQEPSNDFYAMYYEPTEPTIITIDGQKYCFLQDHQLGYQSVSIQPRHVY